MCVSPIIVKNPSYYKKSYVNEYGDLKVINPSLINSDEYIEVPCGKCSECRQTYINSIIQRAIIESLTSYVYFITLTYDNKHIPVLHLRGRDFYYSDYKHIQDMFKRFRAGNHLDRDFRYLCVNEYGDTTHRPHFHILLFVSKKEGDIDVTPHYIRDILFNNLQTYYAINLGTRKQPIYEKLFTYCNKYEQGKGYTTNYYVKYVDRNEFNSFVNHCSSTDEYVQDPTSVKSIRYLVGYVNKPSKFEEFVDRFIDSYKLVDEYMYKKLRHILRCQVRYSKGFGCGFDNGKKYYLPRISVRCSSNVHVYTEIIDSLPKSYEEFVELYPSVNEELLKWRNRDYYQFWSRWDWCLRNMTSEEYMYHCMYVYYFRDEFSSRFKRFKKDMNTSVSLYFHNIHNFNNKYYSSTVRTYKPDNSKLYNYLREMVEQGIKSKVPFIAFRMDSQQSFVPMCKYYKDRCTTIDDIYDLYQVLGIKNYKEWLSLFNKVLSPKKALKQQGNVFKHHSIDIVDSSVLDIRDNPCIYSFLFNKC